MSINTVAKGHATELSERQLAVIAAAYPHGRIERGALADGEPVAPLTVLKAMAARGYVVLTGDRYRPNGALVTELGWRRARRAVGEQAEAAFIARAIKGE